MYLKDGDEVSLRHVLYILSVNAEYSLTSLHTAMCLGYASWRYLRDVDTRIRSLLSDAQTKTS